MAGRLVNLDLDLLRAFVTVAESQSFTRAGARLGRSQSATSLQIQRLEVALDVVLFTREARRVCLTPSGEALLVQAKRMLRLNDEIVAGLVDQDIEGEVRFGAPEDFATSHLPSVLGAFARAHPHVSLTVTCDLTLHLMELLSKGELDLALVKREPLGPDVGVRAWREQLVWVAGEAEAAGSQATVPLVVAPAPCVYRKRAISSLDTAGRPWRIAYTSPSLAGQHAALRAGLGVSALPLDMVPPDLEVLGAEAALPKLPDTEIALIKAKTIPIAADRLAEFVLHALNTEKTG